jgi:hypothetical protein
LRRVIALALLFSALVGHAYDGKLFSLAVGAKAANDVVRRGARLYDGVQASPIVYIGLFDERIQFFLNSLEATDFVFEDVLRLRTKLNLISDRPFLKTSGPLTARNARPSSIEWTSRLEAFFPSFNTNWLQIDLSYSKDIQAHGGNYIELVGRVTVARLWMENEKAKVQPQLFASLGWGDARHNQYLYGAGSGSAGLNHIAYGIMVAAPARIDPHFPVLQLYRYDVLGQANRNGSLVSQTFGYHLDAIFALGIL